MALLITVLVFAVVGVAGWFFGVDSRDGRDWKPLNIPNPTPPRRARCTDGC